MIVAVFGVVGVIAALARPDSRWTFAIPSVVAGLVAVIVLRILVDMLRKAGDTIAHTTGAEVGEQSPPDGVGRRFLLAAGAIA
ncbi:oxidoreductase, partial [Streptomyces sp. SID10244]|nr:oxidoreductase [Streptomyces sp. SID10244]